MPQAPISAFLSSTFNDLSEYREAAMRVCRKFQIHPVAMEDFPAMPAGATRGSKTKLEQADLFIGIYAYRHGYVEKGHQPKSVTEEEFDHAIACGFDRFCFLVDPQYDWPGEKEDGEAARQLQEFKKRVEAERIRAHFTTVENFRYALMDALHDYFLSRLPALENKLTSGRLPLPEGNVPPGKLLSAAYEVVEFDEAARAHELAALQAWFDREESTSVQLLTGPGGSGKTRLMIETIRRRREEGWIAGFLHSDLQDPQLTDLLLPGPPRLLILDYAETRFELTKRLLKLLAQRNPKLLPKIRLALVARDQGDWWRQLLENQGNAVEDLLKSRSPKPIALSPLAEKETDLEAAFHRAARFFASAQNKRLPDPLKLPNLGQEKFQRALYLHMAALAAVDGVPTQSAEEALYRTLNHERRFWEEAASELSGNNPTRRENLQRLVEVAVTLLTLAGGTSTPEATQALLADHLGDLNGPDNLPAALLTLLRNLYANPAGDLLPLQPDLLGEELVHQTLENHRDLLDQYLPSATAAQTEQALDILHRITRDLDPLCPWLTLVLRSHFQILALSALALSVRQNDTSLGKYLAEQLRRNPNPSLAEAISDRCARSDFLRSVPLREIACLSIEIELKSKQVKWTSPSDEQRRELAGLASNWGYRLSELGQSERALKATQQAVAILRQLANDRPSDFGSALAGSLNNLGALHNALGQRAEALAVAQESVNIFEQLGKESLGALQPYFAGSLSNLGTMHSALGKHEEALKTTQQAVDIFEQLAKIRPDTFQPELARTLNNLGNRHSALGQRVRALEATRQAVENYRQLTQDRPDAFQPELAMSLNNLGTMYRALGQREQALGASLQAVEIYRQLARDHPDAFRPDLATSLSALGSILVDADPLRAAAAFGEAIDLLNPHFLQLPAAFAGLMRPLRADYLGACEAAGLPVDVAKLEPIDKVLQALSQETAPGSQEVN